MSDHNITEIKRSYLSFLMLFLFFVKVPIALTQFKINKVETIQPLFAAEKSNFNISPILRYNRVQGLVLGLDLSNNFQRLWKIELSGKFCYGFNDKSRYSIGLQKSSFETNPLTIGANYFNQVTSQDDWIISYNENSAAAFFLKEDFMDYYIKKGVLGFIDQKFREVHTIRLEIEKAKYQSISRQTNWALFGKNKNFRENPLIHEEEATAIRVIWVLDWRDNPLLPMSGWYLEGKGEQTFGDDVDTRGFFMTVKRYQTMFNNHLMKIKLLIGSRTACDYSYDQYLMDMGGIGTLVAYKDKEFQNGNRFLYMTMHYLFNGAILGRLPLNFLPFYDQLTLGIFAETGWLGFVDPNINLSSGFDDLTVNEMKSDVGLSLYITEGLFRVDVAKRTDRKDNSWRVTFRVMNKF